MRLLYIWQATPPPKPRIDRELGLPAYGLFGLELVNEGTFDQPTFSFRTNWRRQNGAAVVGAERRGAVLRVGERWHRLPPMLFRIADLADRFNVTSVEDPDARLRLWAALQAELPEGSAESLKTTGYLAQLRIAYAGAFSLDVTGDLANVDFDPVLHADRPRPELTEQPEECGDEMMRAMLYEAAHTMLVRSTKWSWLKAWAMKIARHRGMKKAIVALARRLAVILHRIWVDGTEFRWTREQAATAA